VLGIPGRKEAFVLRWAAVSLEELMKNERPRTEDTEDVFAHAVRFEQRFTQIMKGVNGREKG